jgi:outer membrane lipoprotein SlyB
VPDGVGQLSGRGHVRVPGRPSFALSRAVAAAVFSLIVEEDVPRRNSVRLELILDRGQYLVARVQGIGTLRRSDPPGTELVQQLSYAAKPYGHECSEAERGGLDKCRAN